MKDTIRKEQVFKHSIDTVWSAITKAEEISTWFLKADFKAEKGYSYTFTPPDDNDECTAITGIVQEANPYTLVYTWTMDSLPVITTVSWTLEETNEGTKLVLLHSGISKFPGATAVKMFESFNGGWIGCLSGLTKYLGKLVDAK